MRPIREPGLAQRMGESQFAIRQLQRRPAPTSEAALGTISAVGHDYGQSRQLVGGGTLGMQFQNIYFDDDSFGYAVVTAGPPKRAQFITISEPGWYMYVGRVAFASDFSVGDGPFIQASCYFPSGASEDVLDNSVGLDGWGAEALPSILEEQHTADEMAFHVLIATRFFNFDPDVWGEDSIGLGVNIGASVTRTKTFQGSVEITRLDNILTLQTIV